MITVFGSISLDVFVRAESLPPLDTSLAVDNHQELPGGKGANQAIAAAKAGSAVKFYGAVGKGAVGEQLKRQLAEYNIDVSGVQAVDGPSGLAMLFLDDHGGHRAVISRGANGLATSSTVPDAALIANGWLLAQATVSLAEVVKLFRRAKQKNMRTILNLAPFSPMSADELRLVDYLIVNEHELAGLCKALGITALDILEQAKQIQKISGSAVIATLGGDGSLAIDAEGKVTRVPCLQVEIIDLIGAGDAYAGYFAASIAAGKNLQESMRRASIAGSLTCTQLGAQTAIPDQIQVDKYMTQLNAA